MVALYRDPFFRRLGWLFQPARDEELLISYNKVSQHSINIVDVLTGNCFVISQGNAFEDITALEYDEERNEIYAGNSRGFVQLWSN